MLKENVDHIEYKTEYLEVLKKELLKRTIKLEKYKLYNDFVIFEAKKNDAKVYGILLFKNWLVEYFIYLPDRKDVNNVFNKFIYDVFRVNFNNSFENILLQLEVKYSAKLKTVFIEIIHLYYYFDFKLLEYLSENEIEEKNILLWIKTGFLYNVIRPIDIIYLYERWFISKEMQYKILKKVKNWKLYFERNINFFKVLYDRNLSLNFPVLTFEEIDRYVRWWEYKVYVEFQEDKNSDRFKYWLRKWLMAEEIWWGKVLFRWWIVLRLDKPILTKKEWEKLKKVIEEVRRDIEKEKRVIDNTKRELKDLKENIIE